MPITTPLTALASASSLDEWIERSVGAPAAEELRAALATVSRRLSAASGALVGAAATLELPDGEHLPGDELRVRVVLSNEGSRPLHELRSTLRAPAGWSVAPAGRQPGSVPAGGSVAHEYVVRIGPDEAAGAHELTATMAYRFAGGTATLPASADLDVLQAVAVAGASVAPEAAQPGERVVVRTALRNRTGVPRTGEVAVSVPDGWTAPAPVRYELAPGAEATVETPLEVPLAVTQGAATMTASTGAEQASAPLRVVFTNPPATFHDHADLGNGASERAHRLTASPASGTNVEAGLTRRYTNSAQPGGWFELDLRVAQGERFVMRAIETYDQAQLKTYDVLVDGKRVLSRAHRRTEGGAGSLSFQFVVDEPELTQDGVVRVRFQDTGADYDPSIADVWTMPAGAG